MGSATHSSNYQNFIKNNNIIQDYARDYKNEYLFIRGIDKTCEKFLNVLETERKKFDKQKANKIVMYINKFLKAQQLGYLNDINLLILKVSDVGFIETLESLLHDYRELFIDPDSYEFDQEKYDNYVEKLFPGFKKIFESFKSLQGKFNVNCYSESECEKLINSVTYSDSDISCYEDSETDSDSNHSLDSDLLDEILSDSDSGSD